MNLRAKVLAPLAAALALLVGYLYGVYMPRSFANIEASVEAATKRHLESVSEGLVPLLLARQLDTIYENLDALMEKNEDWVEVQLEDHEGRSLYPLEATSPPQRLDDAHHVHLLTQPIDFLDTHLGTLRVRADFTPALAEANRQHRQLLAIAMALLGAFVLLAALVLDRLVIRPVHALGRASLKLARGDFDAPLPHASHDEVGALVGSFDEMRGAIRGYQGELLERSQFLQRSEQRLAEAQRIAHLGAWELELATDTLTWSDETYRIFGLEPRAFVATYEAFLDRVHPEDRDAVDRAYTSSVRDKVPYDITHRIVRASDGAVRYVHERCEHIVDERGDIIVSRGTVHDVTERWQAEAESRELAAIVASSEDAIFSKTLDGTVLTWNRAAEEMYGYSAAEIKGRSVSILSPPEEDDDALSILALAGRGEHIHQHETVRVRKDGTRLHVALTVSPLRDAAGTIVGASTIARDITEKKRTAQELEFKNVLLSTQHEASLDGVLAVDEASRIISYNRRFAEIWGLSPELVARGSDDEALAAAQAKLKDPETFLAKVRELYADRSATSRDALDLLDGRTFDRYSAPMVGPEGQYFGRIWYFRDVTEQKKLEEQLRQAQKMEAIGQLAGGIAHDFNNILTAIIGYGNLLRMKLAPDEPARADVEHLLGSAERAAHLTHSLLAFSRKQVMDLKAVELNEIIARAEKFLRRIIGEDVELYTDLRGAPVVMADSGQLEQVVMNLATNARDAMPQGGRLVLETAELRIDAESAPLHGVEGPGTYVVLSVTDTGCGMDERTKEKLFEPFFTTKEVGRGTGLGMSIVYGIVHQHRGHISVYSQLGHGTTFRIYLPRHRRPAERDADTSVEAPIVGGTETLLLAEDDDVLRTLFESLLQQVGYTVRVVANGREAVDAFRDATRPIDLCVLDMIMPKMSGREAFEQIRERRADVRALFMSGYTADKTAREGLPQGCAFIEKPVEPQALLRTIRDMLDRGPTRDADGAEPERLH